MRRLAWLGLALLGGCVDSGPRACTELDTKPMLIAELFFGRDIEGSAGVTDADWNGFLADTLAVDAQGQWLDPERRAVSREATKYVVIAADDTAKSLQDLDAVMKNYERRFHQQSIGLLLDHRCGVF